jgi:hypothetical protein
LLTLEPDLYAGFLKCTLRIASMSEEEDYEALSYVWGEDTGRKTILLNKEYFQISKNLDAALRQLRSDQPLTLWIDAICINQKDDEEKGWQVGMMAEIYRDARRTIIWLGHETPESTLAFDFLATLEKDDMFGESSDETDDLIRWEADLKSLAAHIWALATADLSIHRGVKALLDNVVSREWWRRVWVVQEAAVSQELVLKCGQREIPWRVLAKVVYVLLHGPMARKPNY